MPSASCFERTSAASRDGFARRRRGAGPRRRGGVRGAGREPVPEREPVGRVGEASRGAGDHDDGLARDLDGALRAPRRAEHRAATDEGHHERAARVRERLRVEQAGTARAEVARAEPRGHAFPRGPGREILERDLRVPRGVRVAGRVAGGVVARRRTRAGGRVQVAISPKAPGAPPMPPAPRPSRQRVAPRAQPSSVRARARRRAARRTRARWPPRRASCHAPPRSPAGGGVGEEGRQVPLGVAEPRKSASVAHWAEPPRRTARPPRRRPPRRGTPRAQRSVRRARHRRSGRRVTRQAEVAHVSAAPGASAAHVSRAAWPSAPAKATR